MKKYPGIFQPLIIFIIICLASTLPINQSALANAFQDEYDNQWGLEAINAATAYKLGYTGAGILVGVIDTGINASHAEFINRGVLGVSEDLDMENSHGSHVSGIIGAARNGVGMHGVAYDCQLMVHYGGDEEYIQTINALKIMTDPHNYVGKIPLIINNSWGFTEVGIDITDQDETKELLKNENIQTIIGLISKSVNQGQLLVFSAGNDALDNPETVAGLPYLFPELNLTKGFLTVVGTDSSGDLAYEYSNQAGVAKYWTIAAPGGGYDREYDGIYSVDGGTANDYVSLSGTSMAAPHVSGAAALVWQKFPHFTNTQVAQMLLLTADATGNYSDMDTYGWGLLNVGNAVQGIVTRDYLNFTQAGDFILVVPLNMSGLYVTVNQNSNFVLEGNYTFSGIEVSDGGILTVNRELTSSNDIWINHNSFLKGSGSILDSTVNIGGGTLAPGNSPGVLKMKDSLINFYSGSYQPFLSDYGYSQLLLTDGSVLNFFGDVRLAPQFPDGYQAKIGGKYTVLNVSPNSAVIGNFSGINQLTTPGIQYDAFNAVNSSGEFNLYITPKDYTDTANIGLQFNKNQAQIASVWQKSRPQDEITELSSLSQVQQDIYPLIYSLDAAALKTSASQMSGQLIADTRAGMFNQLRSVNESLSEMNTSKESVKIFGQELRISDGQFSGGSLKTSGVIINHELGSDDKRNYGIGFSVASGKQRNNENLGRGTIDSYSLHLYQNTYHLDGKYWFGQLGLGQTRQEINRQVSGADANLNSSGTGNHFFAALGAGKMRNLGDGSLKVETTLFWENAKMPAVNETGNQTFALKSASGHDNRLAAQILLKRKHILNAGKKLTTALETNLGVSHDFNTLQNRSDIEWLGYGLNIKSEKLGATAFKYGLGVSWNWNKKRELKLMASGEKCSNANKGAVELFYKMKY